MLALVLLDDRVILLLIILVIVLFLICLRAERRISSILKQLDETIKQRI